MDALLPPGVVHTWRSGTALSHETRCETCGWESGACFLKSTAVEFGRKHWRREHEGQS